MAFINLPQFWPWNFLGYVLAFSFSCRHFLEGSKYSKQKRKWPQLTSQRVWECLDGDWVMVEVSGLSGLCWKIKCKHPFPGLPSQLRGGDKARNRAGKPLSQRPPSGKLWQIRAPISQF